MVYRGKLAPGYSNWIVAGYKGHTAFYSYLNEIVADTAWKKEQDFPRADDVRCLNDMWDALCDACGHQATHGRSVDSDAAIEEALKHVAIYGVLILEKGAPGGDSTRTVENVIGAVRQLSAIRCPSTETPDLSYAEALIIETCGAIHSAKNQDYAGSGSDPLRNFRACERVGIPAHLGALTRMSDKQSRLESLGLYIGEVTRAHVADESIDNTLVDLINYALLTAVLRQESAASHNRLTTWAARQATRFLPVRMAL